MKGGKTKTDLDLIREFKKGNQRSFEELLERYTNKVYSLASRFTRNQEDSEEVLQDVFITVFRKIAGFEGKSSFSSWLYRVTVNAAFMKLRKRRQNRSVPLEDVIPHYQNTMLLRTSEKNHGDSVTHRNQLLSAMEEAIRQLPEDYRPVFVLRDIDGLSSREVSKILNISVAAVKSRLHRSRLMLRNLLQPLYREFRATQEGHSKAA